MNKAELIEAVADATDTSKAEASRTLDAVLDSIAGALSNGDSVALVGFGTFNVIQSLKQRETRMALLHLCKQQQMWRPN